LNGGSKLDQDSEDISELTDLPGLKAVMDQLAARIAVLQAEQARRNAGVAVRRPAWKNLVFTGGPGTGKSGQQRLSPGTTGTWDCCSWGTWPRQPPRT
jgi:hypothetical protein